MPARGKTLSWIALFVVYLVWGSTYLGIRVAVASIPPYLMTGCRYIIAGLLLFALQWLFTKEKPPMPTREQLARIAVTAVLLLVIGNGLLCVVETRQQSGTSRCLSPAPRSGWCCSIRCAPVEFRGPSPSPAWSQERPESSRWSARAPHTPTRCSPRSCSWRRFRGPSVRSTPATANITRSRPPWR